MNRVAVLLGVCLAVCLLWLGLGLPGPAWPVVSANSFSAFSSVEEQTTAKTRRLDLNEACRIALESNPSLQAALERVMQAEQRVAQAKSLYWPKIRAALSASRVGLSEREVEQNRSLARLFDSNTSVDDSEDQYTAGITASLLLFDGLKRHFSNLAANLDYEQSIWAEQEVKRQLLFAVSQSFYNAQLARANIRIAEADETFQQRQLQEAEARQRSGTGSLSDVLNFKVRLNAARANGIRANESFQVAQAALAALMGYEQATLPLGMKVAPLEAERAEELKIPEGDQALAYARTHRPDLLQLEYQLKGSTARIKVARGSYFPELNLEADLRGFRPEDGSFEEDDFGHSVSLNLTYTLFDGGQRRAVLEENRSVKREIRQDLNNVQLELASEIQQTIAALQAARQQLLLQRDNLELVRTTRDLVEKEYAAGVESLVRLNESQRDLVRAESELALALVSLRQARIDFQSSTGRILDLEFQESGHTGK